MQVRNENVFHCPKCSAHLFGTQPTRLDGYLRLTCRVCATPLQSFISYQFEEVTSDESEEVLLAA